MHISKEEIGVFCYYKNIDYKPYPFLLFKEFNTDNIGNYFLNKYNNSEVVLNKEQFNNGVLLNDIIKRNDDYICFSAVSTNKETLYIILINTFGERQIKIRYYSLQVYPLFNYKILFYLN